MTPIKLDEFRAKMEKVSDLTGYPITPRTVESLHDELKGEDRQDVLYALKWLCQAGERPNHANITKHLNEHKIEQRARYRAQERRNETNEWAEFINDPELSKEIKEYVENMGGRVE